MESELLRPFRALLLRGFGSQGVALGYNITPFQGLMLVWRDTHEYRQEFRGMPAVAGNLRGCGYI